MSGILVSYVPTATALNLLYVRSKATRYPNFDQNVTKYTVTQIREGITESVRQIRTKQIYPDLSKEIFWLADGDYVRAEFLNALIKNTHLHYNANFDNIHFKKRFACELMHWGLRNEEELTQHNLTIARQEDRWCLSVIRKFNLS